MLVNTQNIHQSQAFPLLSLLQSPPTQPNPNRIRYPSVAIKGAHLFGRIRGSKTTQIWGDGIVPCGSQGCQLCSPGIPQQVTKPQQKWWKMIWNDMKCVCFSFCSFWRFTFFNELKYLQKTLEMLDFHRKKAHGKAMISSSFVRYDLKTLIEGRRR